MNPFKSKAFLELKKEWYGRLKTDGFFDIESSDGNLKIWHTYYFAIVSKKTISYESRFNYYYYAAHFLNDHTFSCPVEEKIWALHCGGMSARAIARHLREELNKTLNKDNVSQKISYLRRDLNSYMEKIAA